jgi:hydrogenase maturation protease
MTNGVTSVPIILAPIVLGIGPLGLGDDGAGRCVARLLRRRAPHVLVAECDGDVGRLLESLQGRSQAILVGSSRLSLRAGRVRRYLAHVERLPHAVGTEGSGPLGLGDAIALARAMNMLPTRVIVYTIEAGDCSRGDVLSPAVQRAVETLADTIARELEAMDLVRPERGPERRSHAAGASALRDVTSEAWPRNGRSV